MNKARIEITPKNEFIAPSINFIVSFMEGLKAEKSRIDWVKKTSEFLISLLVERNSDEPSENLISVSVFESDGRIVIEFENRGTPIFLNTGLTRKSDIDFASKFYEATKNMDSVSVENMGREGQKIIFQMRLGSQSSQNAFESEIKPAKAVSIKDEKIEIRELVPGEELKLSRLFYSVYWYKYIQEFVYYPEKIQEMIKNGKLVSIVAALSNGRILGHVGLVKWNDSPPVYEAALGLVDPSVKAKGIFGKIFHKIMEKANSIPMQYCFFDFVTNHDITQKFISKYGTIDMALLIGSQSKTTQANLEKLGIGTNPKDTDRYTILFSIIPRVKSPFGTEIPLPSSLGESLEFLLKPLSLNWVPEPRFSVLALEGNYKTQYQPNQGSVIFDFFSPGKKAAERIINDWKELLKNDYQYCAVDVPAGSSGFQSLYGILAENGFFIAGFMPYHYSDKLCIRFQSIAPRKVGLENIKVASENAKKLFELIKTENKKTEFRI